MRAVAIAVVLFALLAFDLVHNNGEWLDTATGVANDIVHEVRQTIFG
jgi:hypothetical protein